ncbi:DHH family protein [Bordetella holmesii 70147]|nr:DHH family protein [Bordetella holmesii 70147]
MVTPRLTVRSANLSACQALQNAGIHPLLARLWAARGVTEAGQTQMNWPSLLPPGTLTHSEHAAAVLADAIAAGKRLLIVADYDCDGATACAVGLRALTAMGANVDFLVPNRFETGYGLSPAVIDLAIKHRSGKPDLIVTVDNGIASVDGVAAANDAGIGVVITDHHLPGDTLPRPWPSSTPTSLVAVFPPKIWRAWASSFT